MKKLLLTLSLALTFPAVAASAADLPPVYKAPAVAAPVAYCTLTYCSGLYVGGELLESGGNFNVAATGLSGLADNNFAMGGHVGYQYWNGKIFAAVEGGGDYGLIQKGAIPGGGNQGLWDAYAIGKLGYSLADLFNATTSGTATPTLPTSIANALIAPYVAVGIWCRPWGCGTAVGPGVEGLVATNWTLSVDWLYVSYNNAAVNPIVSQQSESLIRASLDYHF
jgi:opacity protein-like surface antigen